MVKRELTNSPILARLPVIESAESLQKATEAQNHLTEDKQRGDFFFTGNADDQAAGMMAMERVISCAAQWL